MSLTHSRDEPNTYRVRLQESQSPFQYMVPQQPLTQHQGAVDIGYLPQRMAVHRSRKEIDHDSELSYRSHAFNRNPNTQYPNHSPMDTVGDTFDKVSVQTGRLVNQQGLETRLENQVFRREWHYPSTALPLSINPQDERTTGRFDPFLTQLFEKDHFKLKTKPVINSTNEVKELQREVAAELPRALALAGMKGPPGMKPVEHFRGGGCGC